MASYTFESEGFDVNDVLVINVGGVRHEVLRVTLQAHKGSKLANLESLKAYYRRDHDEYYFDRDPSSFAAILNYYRIGELHLPQGCCGPAFKHELNFWGLDEEDIQECCWVKYCSDNTTKQSLLSFDQAFHSSTDGYTAQSQMETPWMNTCASVLTFLDEPVSSVYAKIYMVISFLFIMLSVTVFCAETFPGMMTDLGIEDYALFFKVNVSTLYRDWYHIPPGIMVNKSNINQFPLKHENATTYKRDSELMVPNKTLGYLDIACMVFFTTELVVRFIFTLKKLRFFTNWLNVLDMLSVVPFYIELIVQYVSVEQLYRHNLVDALFVLKVLRLFRILRLLRHYTGLQVLALTLKYSWRELMLLSVIIMITMLVFSSLIFFSNKNNVFKSIPHSFWWAIITMTTVGYGDMTPSTDSGYVIGAACAMSGVLVIAFTVPTIVSNFMMFYTHVIYRKQRVLAYKQSDRDLRGDFRNSNSDGRTDSSINT